MIQTKYNILDCAGCSQCPSKLYAKQDTKVKLGFGNVYANKLIILPVYSIDYAGGNYISAINIIKDYVKDIEENYYVTMHPKCYIPQYDIRNNTGKYCAWILNKELNKINAKYLLAFGDVDLSVVNATILAKFIIKRYFNPYCMVVGNNYVKEKFKEQIKEMESL